MLIRALVALWQCVRAVSFAQAAKNHALSGNACRCAEEMERRDYVAERHREKSASAAKT
jgi:xanthine dehydrogenase iron-sulfur cluster and FAD-binding subunit A